MYPSEALHNVYSEVKNASSSAVESQLYNTQPIPVSLKLAIRVSKLWAIFELECLLLVPIFIYPKSKLEVIKYKRGLRMPAYIRDHTKENPSTFLTLYSPFYLFIRNISQLNCLRSPLKYITLDVPIRGASQCLF